MPPISADDVADVLTPRGCGVIQVPAEGDLRLVLGGSEMLFSGEDAVWRFCFEGETEGGYGYRRTCPDRASVLGRRRPRTSSSREPSLTMSCAKADASGSGRH